MAWPPARLLCHGPRQKTVLGHRPRRGFNVDARLVACLLPAQPLRGVARRPLGVCTCVRECACGCASGDSPTTLVPGAICQPPPARESPLCDGPSCPPAHGQGGHYHHHHHHYTRPYIHYCILTCSLLTLVWSRLVSSGSVRKSALARSLPRPPAASACAQAAVPARTLQQGGASVPLAEPKTGPGATVLQPFVFRPPVVE